MLQLVNAIPAEASIDWYQRQVPGKNCAWLQAPDNSTANTLGSVDRALQLLQQRDLLHLHCLQVSPCVGAGAGLTEPGPGDCDTEPCSCYNVRSSILSVSPVFGSVLVDQEMGG